MCIIYSNTIVIRCVLHIDIIYNDYNMVTRMDINVTLNKNKSVKILSQLLEWRILKIKEYY